MSSPQPSAMNVLARFVGCTAFGFLLGGNSSTAQDATDDRLLQPLPPVIQQDRHFQTVAMQELVNPAEEGLFASEEIEAPVPADNSAPKYTLESLEAMALGGNPSIARADAEVRSLRGKWVQVGLPPNPTVGYLGNEIGNDGAAGQQGSFVGQQYITGGKLCLNRQIVSQEIRSAEQRLAAQQQRVRTDVRLNYYNALAAQRKLELARELVEVNSNAVRASQELLKAQEISRAALLQTEIQQSNASILLQRAENEWQASWRRLSAVVGQSIELEPQPLDDEPDIRHTELSWEGQLTRMIATSPEIAEAVAELQRTRWALDRACAEIKPNVQTQVSVQYDDATDYVVTGVQVGIPLPIWNRNQGGIRRARAEISAAQQNIEQVELDLKRRLAEAFQAYSNARMQVERLSEEILPKAKETFQLVRQGYEIGEVGYLDLLAAQRTYSQTSLSHIEAQRALWQSTVLIDGLLLESSLQQR